MPALEIIVVDDGSTDPNTLRVLEDLEKQGGLLVLRQENQGPSVARNKGIEVAAGEYILCLDADDRLRESFLSLTEPIFDGDPGIGIAYGRAEYFGERSGRVALPPYKFPDVILDPCIFSTALFRKKDWEDAGGFDESRRDGWEDFDFWLSLIGKGREVAFVDEVLFDYRQHHESRDRAFSEDRERLLDAFVFLFERHEPLYRANIRVLFAAHLERLQWRSLFPEDAVPELFIEDDSIETTNFRASSGISGADAHSRTVRINLSSEKPLPHRFRFDPFSGPGRFKLEGVCLIRGKENADNELPGETAEKLNPNQWEIERHSFARVIDKGEWEGGLFYLGPDASLHLVLDKELEMRSPLAIEFYFRAEFGPEIADGFIPELRACEEEFRLLYEQRRRLELEVAHVKKELESEIGRRRAIQKTISYRIGRAFAKIFGR